MRMTQEQQDQLDREHIRREVAQEIFSALDRIAPKRVFLCKRVCMGCYLTLKAKYLEGREGQ